MEKLPHSLRQVKYISFFIVPPTNVCVQFLESARRLYSYPFRSSHVPLFDVLVPYSELKDKTDWESYQGVAIKFHGEGKITVLVKEYEGITTYQGVPVEVTVILVDAADNPEFYGVAMAPLFFRITRKIQPGEIDELEFIGWKGAQKAKKLAEQDPKWAAKAQEPADQDAPGQDKPTPPTPETEQADPIKRPSHIRLLKKPKPKPKPPTTKLELSLSRISFKPLPWLLSLGLPIGPILLYLIIRHFPAKHGRKGEFQYTDMWIKQMAYYLHCFIPIFLRHALGPVAEQASKVGTDPRTIYRYLAILDNHRLVRIVLKGKEPKLPSIRIVALGEEQRRRNVGSPAKPRPKP